MTPELMEIRRGRLTASNAAKIMGDLSTEGLKTYVRKCAGERVYGDLEEEGFKSAKMQDGNECEPEALDWAEFHFNVPLRRQVFLVHPEFPYVAAIPDALAPDFAVEVKSPLFHVWAETVERAQRVKGIDAVPSQYRWQCRWQLWCAGMREGRFVNYHRKPGGFVVAYTVTDEEIEQMTKRAQLVEGLVRNWVDLLQDAA